MNRAILINRISSVSLEDRILQDILRSLDADLVALPRTILTKDDINVLILAALLPLVLRPPQIVADMDDYIAGPIRHGTTVFADLDADHTITGISSTKILDGTTVHLINISAFTLILQDSNVGSRGENRFLGQGGADVTLKPGFAATLVYDQMVLRWRAREE